MADTDQAAPPRPYVPTGRRFVARKFPRSFVPRRLMQGEPSLFHRAASWLLPWARWQDYPGRGRGLAEALGGLLTLSSVRTYMKRPQPFSARVALALRDLIVARVERGQALAAELEWYAAEHEAAELRRRQAGFMRVDSVTGLSGRPKTGKRRSVTSV